MLILVLSGIGGWLLGSLPSAYVVVRLSHGVDLSEAGSANVGANNAMRVTGSRRVGLIVLLLDALKGIAAVLVGWGLAHGLSTASVETLAWWAGAIALLCAITGHNYNLPLSFRRGRLSGGKGLATAAGGFLLVTPWLVAVWAVLWVTGRWLFERWRGVRDSIPGNVLATALIPIIGGLMYGPSGLLVTVVFALLVLPKHRDQVRALLATRVPETNDVIPPLPREAPPRKKP